VPPLPLDELEAHAGRIAGEAGIQAAYVPFVTVLVGNEAWRDTVASVPFDRRVLLLPQCLRDRRKCPAELDEFGLLCEACGQCPIGGLQTEAESLGYVVLVAEGTTVVTSLLEQGKVAAAISHYLTALRLKPDYAETYNNLGVAMFRQRELDRARAHYLEALRLDPDFGKAHNNLGNVLVEKGQFDEAIFHYSMALKTKAYYPEAHNNLGVALAHQGKLNEAVVQFTEALRLKPDYHQARANLDLALALVGKATEPANSSLTPLK